MQAKSSLPYFTALKNVSYPRRSGFSILGMTVLPYDIPLYYLWDVEVLSKLYKITTFTTPIS